MDFTQTMEQTGNFGILLAGMAYLLTQIGNFIQKVNMNKKKDGQSQSLPTTENHSYPCEKVVEQESIVKTLMEKLDRLAVDVAFIRGKMDSEKT